MIPLKETKPIWQSKTFWFNLLAILVFVANYYGYKEFQPDPQLIALVVAVVNIGLRYVTDKGVTVT